jgi:hypothetical protein
MQGNDHMSAAEPNWFDQAEDQIGDLAVTLTEINDPSLDEALEAFEAALKAAKARKQ